MDERDVDQPAAPGEGEPEWDELERLRARNQELEQRQLATPTARLGRLGRSVASVVLIVVGVLCLVLSPAVIFGRNLVLDTDRYTQTLAPLASDPGVQQVVVKLVSQQVDNHLDVKSLLDSAGLPPKAQVLAGPLEGAIQSLVGTVTTKFVQSKAFETLWTTVNRTAHQQLDYLLTGRGGSGTALQIDQSGHVILNLAPIVDQVKSQLVAAGLTIAANVPAVGATLDVADLQGIEKARRLVRLLDTAADWLPWIGLVLTAGGIAAASRRRRALIVAALSLGAGMIVIGIALIVGRNIYLDDVSSDVLPRATASNIFDTLVRYLRDGIRAVLLVALLIALGAWLSGPGPTAVRVRHAIARGPQALGRNLDTGAVGPFVLRHATALRVGVIGLMLIILLLVDTPTVGVIVLLAVIAVILLMIIELLRYSVARDRVTPASGPVIPQG